MRHLVELQPTRAELHERPEVEGLDLRHTFQRRRIVVYKQVDQGRRGVRLQERQAGVWPDAIPAESAKRAADSLNQGRSLG
jgi:hypothetical protein